MEITDYICAVKLEYSLGFIERIPMQSTRSLRESRFVGLPFVVFFTLMVSAALGQCPNAGFTVPGSLSGCKPFNASFLVQNTSGNPPNSIYVFNFGDGSPEETYSFPPVSIQHVYNQVSCPTSFAGYLTIYSSCGTGVFPLPAFKVYGVPEPSFIVNPNPGCTGGAIQFTNTSGQGYTINCTAAASNYSWHFGDGGGFVNNNSPTVSHTYSQPGSYLVKLAGYVSYCNSSPDTISHTIEIFSAPPSILLSSAVGTNNQTRCINTAITDITYTTTGASGIANSGVAGANGLPSGVTATWVDNTISITGTPNVTGIFNYSIPLIGGCGSLSASGTITVTPNNTITLTSAVGSNSQTRCVNTAITNITYSTTGASGASVTGLPAGVSGTWASNVFTIQGTPSVSGTFNYTVTMSGACTGGTNTATGTITVTPNNTITLTSAAGSNSQTRCINTPITNITYATTSATGASVTGLPSGVNGNWVANVLTIYGTPSESGTFNFTVTMTGGCTGGTNTATGAITVIPNNTITLTSAPGSNVQTRCINTPISNITYSTTGATGASVTGLPTGVSGTWASNVFTIQGAPSVSGTFNYTITMTGGCTGGANTATGTIIVTPNNTITLTSAFGSNSQTRCINTAITNITYSTTGASGASVTGLPAGVSGTWASNVFTIQGTPSVSGTFNYTVTMTGGCTGGTNTATGTIIVMPNNTITLTSGAGSNTQNICVNTPISNITYSTTGATGAVFNGLPSGVIGNWQSNVVTISDTLNSAGTFNYTVTLTGGCTGGANSASGLIVVNANSILLTSTEGSDEQTTCINAPIENITYSISGASSATVTGLPNGVSGNWQNNVMTISGIPTVSGTYNYTINTIGGCPVEAGGFIFVNTYNTASLTTSLGSNTQSTCQYEAIMDIAYSTTGATGAIFNNLPSGLVGTWMDTLFTISGIPTEAGTFNYSVTLTGGCVGSASSASGVIVVNPINTILLTSAEGTNLQNTCINSAIAQITYSTNGATDVDVIGLPLGVSGIWQNDVLTISGVAIESGSFEYVVMMIGGCQTGTQLVSGIINVNAGNAIALTSADETDAQTTCINTPITNIIYSTTGATGASVDNLPPGVSGTWSDNVFLISGTPSMSGTFSYTLNMTGGCIFGADTVSGVIAVNASNSISLTSAPNTNSQITCINESITDISYTTTGATGASVAGLPAGVFGNWQNHVMTIGGIPNESGTFNYLVLMEGGCNGEPNTLSGLIVVNANNTISLISTQGTDTQTVCLNAPIESISYSTTGATGAIVTNLPAGVVASWQNNSVVISGNPSIVGIFNYTIDMTGGCIGAINSSVGSIEIMDCPIDVVGCMDTIACNYNSAANIPDTTCFYPVNNYVDCMGNCLHDADFDLVCDEQEVFGCTSEWALNFNAEATEEDDSCVFTEDLLIPDGISPNQDGFNDTWEILGLNRYFKFDISVYTMRDELVFRQRGRFPESPYLPWNGRSQCSDEIVPDGAYFYVILVEDGKKKFRGVLNVKSR